MKRQTGRAVLLVTVLLTSVALLAWSILSTWQQSHREATIESAASINEASGDFPPPLDSKAAKAKLFYPIMKSRGPQPGGDLQSKPLVAGMRPLQSASSSETK
jgi:cytochrome oxidase assembly protein ShyY1